MLSFLLYTFFSVLLLFAFLLFRLAWEELKIFIRVERKRAYLKRHGRNADLSDACVDRIVTEEEIR